MSAHVTMTEALRRLDALGDAVKASVRDEAAALANQLAAELRGAYPVVTGNLRKSVRVEHGRRGSYVLARAPHAHLYEWGTRPDRRTYTRAGGPKRGYKGGSPAHHVFVPSAQAARNTYIERLTRLVNGADIEL